MKKDKIIRIFLILLPFIDLFSSLITRFSDNRYLSIGIWIKGIFLLISVLYVLLLSTSKYKKVSLIYYFVTLFYATFYFITKTDIVNSSYLFNELIYMFKFVYFPFIFFAFLNFYEDIGFEKEKLKNVLFITLMSYILLITLPNLFNLDFSSYSNSNYTGSVGWYFAANEVSAILLFLYPFLFQSYKKNWLFYLLFILSIYTISLIGTKVTLLGILVISFLILITSVFKTRRIFSKANITALVMLLVCSFFMLNSGTTQNFEQNIIMQEQEENIEPSKSENKLLFQLRAVLNNRDIYLEQTNSIFVKSPQKYLLFGMGYTNTPKINEPNIEKLIEIDVLDMFYHMGLISIFLFLYPFFYMIYFFFKHNKGKINVDIFFYIMIIGLSLGISTFAGHVYMSPAVSIYIVFYFILLFNEMSAFNKKAINNKKVALIGLHLGYGGIENTITSTANMLCDEYDVEIVSLYTKKEEPFKINNKVKVIHLMNESSNREALQASLNNNNILSFIKETFKSIKILYNKHHLINKYIRYSDAKVIISTRLEFSKLLNENHRPNMVSIHQEHGYRTEKSYINTLKKLNNLKYIMPSGKYLYNEYKKAGIINLRFIPLALKFFPIKEEYSELNTNNLVAVGRLSKEKGMADIVKIVLLLKERNIDVKVNIFGDGPEKDHIEKLIDENDLKDSIKMWGFRKQEFIKKYYKESSLYLLPSYEESFGLVVLEAMSFGIPCIMFDDAKGPLTIVNRDNGFIIKNRKLEKMADTIVKYLSLNQKERKKLGINARLTAEEYKYTNIQKKWLNFIKNISKK